VKTVNVNVKKLFTPGPLIAQTISRFGLIRINLKLIRMEMVILCTFCLNRFSEAENDACLPDEQLKSSTRTVTLNMSDTLFMIYE